MFGMGTGIASPLWPPAFITNFITSAVRAFSAARPERMMNVFRIVNGDENMVKPHDLLVMLG